MLAIFVDLTIADDGLLSMNLLNVLQILLKGIMLSIDVKVGSPLCNIYTTDVTILM